MSAKVKVRNHSGAQCPFIRNGMRFTPPHLASHARNPKLEAALHSHSTMMTSGAAAVRWSLPPFNCWRIGRVQCCYAMQALLIPFLDVLDAYMHPHDDVLTSLPLCSTGILLHSESVRLFVSFRVTYWLILISVHYAIENVRSYRNRQEHVETC